jgi:serine/threonine protein kinase
MISPFIQQVELRSILEKHIRRGLRLFLVPLWPTLYQGSPLERFQWALPPEKPLSAMAEHEQRQAMIDVCLDIAKRLGSLPEPPVERTIEGLRSMPKLDLPSTYELQGHLGEGEFASCFRAKDKLLNRSVIIKMLRDRLARDSDAYDKYVESASRLDHDNILSVLFSQTDKLPNFIVTEDVGDETLEKKLARRSKPPFEEALNWLISLAGTLAYAHEHKCVHGRLRPCEIRFDGSQPILAGFRTRESCRKTPPPALDRQFDLEEFLYASPEYRAHGRIDAKGDQYLLGLVAYEMLAGTPPFRVKSWAAVLDPELAGQLRDPRPLNEVEPDCDERVAHVVMRMLAAEPSARWKSMAEVHTQLEDARSNVSSIEQAKTSYQRFARDASFYRDLYARLFEKIPGIEKMFEQRTMTEQYKVLEQALWLLLTYPSTRPRPGEPTILGGIARTHARFDKKWFDTFEAVVLEVVARRDPHAVRAWKYAMAPGIEYLRARAGKGARARA